MLNKKLVSIIVPVFNEEKNIPLIYDELRKIFDDLKEKYDYELIFIDDGSQDKSQEILEKLTEQNSNIKYIQFSRNFGKEIATTAGLSFSKGRAVIMIDADLQHPPELIPEFLEKWEKGADIIIGVREKNKGEGWIKRFGSFWFYKIMNSIGETKLIPRATDYRLLDKKVIKEFNRFTERNRITRGLIDWLGFKKDYIYFKAEKRKSGKAGYNFLKLTKLALSSFVTHSLFPLKLAGYLGSIITLLSGIIGLFIIVEKYILGDPLNLYFSGPFMLGVLILFLVGIVLSCLGLITLYIANIHQEVVNRPMYVIKKKKNLDEQKSFNYHSGQRNQ